jgi:hypothetical protein
VSFFVTDELLSRWRGAGVSEVIVGKVHGLVGQSFATPTAIYEEAIPHVLTKAEYEELTKVVNGLRVEAGWAIVTLGLLLIGIQSAWEQLVWIAMLLTERSQQSTAPPQ